MEASNKNSLYKQFINDPHSIYNAPEKLDSETIKTLFSLEESLVSQLYCDQIQDLMVAPSSEEELALQCETQLEQNDTSKEIIDHSALQSIMFANQCMESENPPAKPVPAILGDMIARDLSAQRQEANANLVPSILLKLTENSIQIIKSSLQGIVLILETAPKTRSAMPNVQEKQNELKIHQIDPNKGPLLECQIVRESEDEVMLGIQIKQKKGNCRINLKQDNRILASQTLSKTESSTTFHRITEGFYQIEIQGSLERNLNIQISR